MCERVHLWVSPALIQDSHLRSEQPPLRLTSQFTLGHAPAGFRALGAQLGHPPTRV